MSIKKYAAEKTVQDIEATKLKHAAVPNAKTGPIKHPKNTQEHQKGFPPLI